MRFHGSSSVAMSTRVRALLAVGVAIFAAACQTDEINPGPRDDLAPAFTSAADGLGLTGYSAALQRGKFVVCSARSSPAGVTHPIIVVENALPSDRVATNVSIEPGQCVTVFSTRRRGGPVPSITVFQDPSVVSTGSVLFDDAHQTFGVDVYNGSGVPVTHSRVLSGFEGAVVKFYYGLNPNPNACVAEITPSAVCGAGGHGGTGTLNFSLD
jgi:hypothetical protein